MLIHTSQLNFNHINVMKYIDLVLFFIIKIMLLPQYIGYVIYDFHLVILMAVLHLQMI
nr:MAG TPA: hypothetical protein [Bacteriophage sp.]